MYWWQIYDPILGAIAILILILNISHSWITSKVIHQGSSGRRQSSVSTNLSIEHAWLIYWNQLYMIQILSRKPQSSQTHKHTEICVRPHRPAVTSNSWAPLHEVSQADFVVAGSLAANNDLSRILKLLTTWNHARLRGLRRLDGIARTGRCRPSSSSNHSNANIDVDPHTGAIALHIEVPFYKIFKGDLLIADHLAANYTPVDGVAFVAVCKLLMESVCISHACRTYVPHHAWLRQLGR